MFGTCVGLEVISLCAMGVAQHLLLKRPIPTSTNMCAACMGKGSLVCLWKRCGAVKWSQLDEQSMVAAVAENARSRGIVGCRLVKTDRYDHKRHHADRYGTGRNHELCQIWDFQLIN